MAWGTLRAGRRLHDEVLTAVFRAPMAWFDATPVGRTLNLLSADLGVVDTELSESADGALLCGLIVTAAQVEGGTPVTPTRRAARTDGWGRARTEAARRHGSRAETSQHRAATALGARGTTFRTENGTISMQVDAVEMCCQGEPPHCGVTTALSAEPPKM